MGGRVPSATPTMSNLLIGLLGALVATNQPAAVSNLVAKTTGISVPVHVRNTNDPVQVELTRIMEMDEAAQKEADKWIREAQAFEEKGAGTSKATLALRVEQRLLPVRQAYEDFLQHHPNHVDGLVAYASFLSDIEEEDLAIVQWEKARELDPKNPAAWNNLANSYGHRGPIKKSFEYFGKAIELNPNEPVYYHNFATVVYLFRKDAMEMFNLNEQQVFDKALELYDKAVKLDPKNFLLATDVAQSYYGVRPPRAEAALAAWNYALSLASTDDQRQGTYLHLARVELNSGRFEEARKHLALVSHPEMQELKGKLAKNLELKEKKAAGQPVPEPVDPVLEKAKKPAATLSK